MLSTTCLTYQVPKYCTVLSDEKRLVDVIPLASTLRTLLEESLRSFHIYENADHYCFMDWEKNEEKTSLEDISPVEQLTGIVLVRKVLFPIY
jgi:hypothetical protein